MLHKLVNDVGVPEELGNTAREVISCAAPSHRVLLAWASLSYELLFPILLLSYRSINYKLSGAAGLDAEITRVFLFLTFCSFQSQRMSWHQKNLNEERQQQEAGDAEANPVYHCHGYSQAYENRKREQHQARRKLCAASVICIFFMVAEITGEYVCSKGAHFCAQHSCVPALLHPLCLQWPPSHRDEPTWDKIIPFYPFILLK